MADNRINLRIVTGSKEALRIYGAAHRLRTRPALGWDDQEQVADLLDAIADGMAKVGPTAHPSAAKKAALDIADYLEGLE